MTEDIKKILVATDYSDCSQAALERAGSLAFALDATLDAIHVWNYKALYTEVMVGSGPPEDAVRRRKEEATAKMTAFAARAMEQGRPLNQTLIRRGSPDEEIVRAAKEGGYDLIVLGTHGRIGVPRFFMGSVAEHVVRYSEVPVLTVRRH